MPRVHAYNVAGGRIVVLFGGDGSQILFVCPELVAMTSNHLDLVSTVLDGRWSKGGRQWLVIRGGNVVDEFKRFL